MQFAHTDLGHRRGGEIVEVTLSGRANVRLMDSSNFNSYRNGSSHRFIGGQATQSPVRLQIPNSGRWHVAIDLGGYSGQIRTGVRVLPGALPTIQETPLSSIPSLLRARTNQPPNVENDNTHQSYDIFISHASEDKDEIVRPLAQSLQAAGLVVWYDEFELKIGDSLRRKIDKGLANSRFGLVILSQAFFKKGWPNYELDGLVTRANSGEQIILPVWHKVSKDEVVRYSPSLADKLARNTAVHTIKEIASEIASLIRPA
ncbi:MAG: DUF1883 domain-containing protein [Rhodospirillaceae bacterium]|nr:DUF1883 domain-containing protein [Rhodospirillaceae bacterium]